MDKVPQGLPELLAELREKEVPVPDSLTEYFLAKAGCSISDVALLRVVSSGLQLILEGVASDALQSSKRRQTVPATKLKRIGFDGDQKRILLTIEDLKEAFGEAGVELSKPLLYQGTPQQAAAGSKAEDKDNH